MKMHWAVGIALVAWAGLAGAQVVLPPDGVVRDASRRIVTQAGERLHPVRVDRSWLLDSSDLGGVWLPGSGGSPLLARHERTVRASDGTVTWIGKVVTAAGPQSVVLTFGEAAIFGTIPQKSGRPLQLHTRKGRQWLVEDVEVPGLASPLTRAGHSLRPDYLVPDRLTVTAAGEPREVPRMPMATVGEVPVVDVLVLYTPALVANWGSHSAVLTRIAHLEALTNQAYVDSRVAQQIRVVAARQVNYTVRNDNVDALHAISKTSSLPIKKTVDKLRKQYGADLVSLVRDFDRDTQTSCGVAYLGGFLGYDFHPDHGFSVVGDLGVGGDRCWEITFAHELGHNMGSDHDASQSPGQGHFPYSMGYRKRLSGGLAGFGTIMSYVQGVETYLNVFSNPSVATCLGLACGVAGQADNARSLTQTASFVAAFSAPAAESPARGARRHDVNANSFSDLWLLADSTNRLSFWFMKGGSRTATSSMSLAPGQTVIAIGDFNGDYRADFMTRDTARKIMLHTSTGVRFNSTPTQYVHSADYQPLAAADVNGNGKADLLFWSEAKNRLAVWFMSGGIRSATAGVTVPAGFRYVASGDLNADNRADLLFTSPAGTVRALMSTGANFTQVDLANTLGAGFVLVGVADADGDGRADILLHAAANRRLVTWYMDGTTRRATSTTSVLTSETLAAYGDYNGDGRTDLAWVDGTGKLRIRASAGKTYFDLPGELTLASRTRVLDHR